MFTRLNYIRRGADTRQKARAHLGYIGTRPDKNKEEMERLLFGHGGTFTSEQVEEMIKNAPKNTYFWRLILSPDPARENREEDLNLWELTRTLVAWLEARLSQNGIPRDIPPVAGAAKDTPARGVYS